ncbi:MAG TPA: MGMT family protein [Clostridia bacterium]|nr:MGMT family protein [Clostridia bacterium]
MKRYEFFSEVYKIAARIPKGKVMTYGQIAVLMNAPNCARQVGQAMYNTPEHLKIPAHRVVNSKGGLAPPSAFGGEGIQRRRLEAEGVLFKENGCVDLKRSILRDAGNREQSGD